MSITGSRGIVAAPYETFQTQDAYLFLAAPNDQLFARLCAALEMRELLEEERFASNPARLAHRDELHARLEARLRQASAAQWEALLLAAEVPCSRIRGLDQIVGDPQVAALGIMMPLPHSRIDGLRQIDLPFTIDGVRAVRHEPPPELGEHTDVVLRELGWDAARIAEARRLGVVGEAVGTPEGVPREARADPS